MKWMSGNGGEKVEGVSCHNSKHHSGRRKKDDLVIESVCLVLGKVLLGAWDCVLRVLLAAWVCPLSNWAV